jgi:hypothetical protein
VAVDILHNYVGTRVRYGFEAASTMLAVPVFALATWLAAGTLEQYRAGAQASSGLGVPSWTISMVLPVGFGMLTLRLALNAIGYVATLLTGRQITPLPPISGTEEGANERSLITILLFALLAIGMPVAFALVFTGALGLYWVGGWEAMSVCCPRHRCPPPSPTK